MTPSSECRQGYAKLIDCGLAKRLGETENTFTMAGTPVYFSPEMVKHTGYGRKSELWALGVLLHELVCSQPPFQPDLNSAGAPNDKLMALFKLIVRDQPKFKEAAFTPPAIDLITKLLKKHPHDRIALPSTRLHALYDGFNWESFSAKRMPPPFVPKPHPKLPPPR